MQGSPSCGAQAPFLIECRDVTVMRGGGKVLDGVTLSIREGENVAVLGPNGSGKSTFLKLLTRELYPLADGGTLKIRGRERWDLFGLRSTLGIVSDDLQQTCRRDLTVREAVLSGFFGSVGLFRNHAVTADMERRTDRLVEFLEIAHLARRRMSGLSSGEARRALVARALVHEPGALVLDEPFDSLDLHAAAVFRSLLRKVAGAGRNIIMITHDLHDIIPEISRVVMFRKGSLFRDGEKEALLTGPVVSELFSVPVEVRREDGYYHAWS